MRRAFDVEMEIDRPVDEVWSELTAWDRASRWMSGVESMRAKDGTHVGAVLTFESRGRTRRSTISARYAYRLDPDGVRTRARLTADLGTAGLPLSALAPLLRSRCVVPIPVSWTS